MPDAAHASAIKVEVDGRPLDGEAETALLRVVVDDHLHLPDTFEITLQETADMTVADKAHLHVGSAVKVSTSALGNATPSLLVSGEVTALEGVYREGKAPLLLARGYDHGHRLSRGRGSASFQNVTYSDIARSVASRAGLTAGTIDESGRVDEHVGQTGQTDWEFLHGLAREVGFEVAVVEGRLDFRRPREAANAPGGGDFSSTDPLQLVFGQDLLEFRPSGHVVRAGLARRGARLGSRHEGGDRGHGPRPAPRPPSPGQTRPASPRASAARCLIVEGGYPSQAEADRAAEALARAGRQRLRRGVRDRPRQPPREGGRGRQRLPRRRAVRRALHAHPHAPHVRPAGRATGRTSW